MIARPISVWLHETAYIPAAFITQLSLLIVLPLLCSPVLVCLAANNVKTR